MLASCVMAQLLSRVGRWDSLVNVFKSHPIHLHMEQVIKKLIHI